MPPPPAALNPSAVQPASVIEPERATVFYRMCQRLLRLTVPVMARVQYDGMERIPESGGLLLLCNHQSFLDPVLLCMHLKRPCHYMARDSLFRSRWFGGLIRAVNAFPVRRGSADIGALKESLRRLRRGGILVSFPEGTRSPDGRIQTLKPGGLAMAMRAGVPVMPAVLEGMVEVWPRDRRLPRRGSCWIHYGEPLSVNWFASRSPNEAARDLTTMLRDMHNALRQRAARHPFDYTDYR